MNYASVADLAVDIRENLYRIPRTVDLVIGIPRSGMLAGSLIALQLNVPLSDVDTFRAGRTFASGHTRRRRALDLEVAEARHVLVVDDSADTGTSMRNARAALADAPGNALFTFVAVYASDRTHLDADLVLKPLPRPRVFEWNLMHHWVLGVSCVDIDGILCHDPTDLENDDGARYEAFLESARPLVVPTKPIQTLVTSRLERYRGVTERWLAAHHIEYGSLEMLDLPDAATRRRLGAHAPFKAEVYRRSSAALFIESEEAQARVIARRSGKDVLCLTNHMAHRPSPMAPVTLLQRARRSQKLARLGAVVRRPGGGGSALP